MNTMNRREWALVITLTLAAVLMICAVPPPEIGGAPLPEVRAGTAAIVTPTLQVPLPPTPIPPTAPPTATRLPPTATPTIAATATPSATPTAPPSPTVTPYPFDTRPDLARYMYIDQRSQHIYLFEYGELLRAIPCSTGKPDDNSYTPAASGKVGVYVTTFFSFGTHQDDAWYLYHSVGGIYIHGLPYTYDEAGAKVYQDRDALGVRPTSHGCIRIAPEDAVWLREWNPADIPFTVSEPYLELWR